MNKTEYRVYKDINFLDENQMNNLKASGWEVVSASTIYDGCTSDFTVIYEREKV